MMKLMTLAAVAAISLAAGPLDGRHSSPPDAGALPAPESLLGLSADELLDHLGPPHSISAGSVRSTWYYLSRRIPSNSVWLVDDCVIRVGEDVVITDAPTHVPWSGPYLGQPVKDLVKRLGQPGVECSQGQFSDQYDFKNHKISIANGRVVGIKKK